jgi:CheY-like chemotaxis protein
MAHDGMAALQFLRKEQLYSESLQPDLVLLDLNLPPKADRRSWRKSSKIRRSEPFL